jgi:hypothetical protein
MKQSMFIKKTSNASDSPGPILSDPENILVDHIIQKSNSSDLHISAQAITNLYVGLKSKPLTVIVGPSHTGKVATMQNLANGLIGDDPLRCQMMVGHSWWANQCNDIVQFTEAQTRWNSSKVIELIREAGLPENAQRIYMACLTHISPAELNEFFSEVAFQLQHDEVMRVSSVHLSEPIHFPPNMFLVGTMDVNQFKWMDENLLSKTSLIHWTRDDDRSIILPTVQDTFVQAEKAFLKSCLRNVQVAFQKLYLLLRSQREAFFPLSQTNRILQKQKIVVPSSVLQSAMVYIANSWSENGTGLFSLDTQTNLGIALDHAIAQTYLLPFEDKLVDSAALRKNLRSYFRDRFPYSSGLVRNM